MAGLSAPKQDKSNNQYDCFNLEFEFQRNYYLFELWFYGVYTFLTNHRQLSQLTTV
jgi:hypothetical protein